MLAVLAVLTGSTLCPVAALTGTPCPGCGMTRAVVALARGDLSAAWRWHPLAPLVAGYAAGTAIHWRRHLRAYVRGHSPSPTPLCSRRWPSRWCQSGGPASPVALSAGVGSMAPSGELP